MLELLSVRGEVAIAGRAGRQRLWDVPERVYPPFEPVPAAEAERLRQERRLRSLGIARAKTAVVPGEPISVGNSGVAVQIEGLDGEWRADPNALDRSFTGRTALLSPFDRLVHDRDRTMGLFEFEYIIEMYKPSEKRRWGYFALPVLHHDRLVGKLDAKADRRSGTLTVNALHEDLGGQAVDGLTCDASGREGVAGIVELSVPEASLDRAPILGESKWMQIDTPVKNVLKFDPDWKPVLSRHKAERDQQVQEPFQLVSINGKVKILMGPHLASNQRVNRPAARNAGSHALSGYVAQKAGYVAGLHG
jgi:hypothetical protein